MTEIERKYDDSKKVISTYTYDSLNRVTQKVTDYIGFLLGDYITDYTYCDITSSQKTTRIASETCRFDNKELGKFEYTYYPNGNVSKIYKDNTLVREYIYDQYDRLTWEKNYTANFEYSYVYDSNGNLTKKSRATKSSNNSTTSEITFMYGYNGDKIVSVTTTFSDIPGVSSSQNFTYDALGNPTTYNGMPITWQGRKLMSVGDTTMQYDYNGMRTRKGERVYKWYISRLAIGTNKKIFEVVSINET